jgi:DnaJ domain
MNLTYYKTLGISIHADTAEIHRAYIALARKYHPDATGGDKTKEERFKEIVQAHEVLSDPEKRKRYDALGTAASIVIPSKRGKYTVETRIASGDLADVYKACREDGLSVVLKIAKHPAVNDLLECEHKRLIAMWPDGADKTKYGYYYLPRPVDSFLVDDGKRRRINVFEHIADHGTLQDVRQMFPEGVEFRHGVWMFNRLLEALRFVHDVKGQIHGALVPSNVLIWLDPQGHLIKLLGWGHSGRIGEKIGSVSQEWKTCYPPEVFTKRGATPATDIYMAAKLTIYVLGGNVVTGSMPLNVPTYLQNFLRGCLLSQGQRPQNAWALHEELRRHMEKYYGPKQFVPFTNPAWKSR